MTGTELITAERLRQIEQESFTWKVSWAKRESKDRIRQLVVAGALIAAEIDRLQKGAAMIDAEQKISAIISCASSYTSMRTEIYRQMVEPLEQQLAEAQKRGNAFRQQLLDLMSESTGVTDLHRNGDVAEWEWLIDNGWLSMWAEAPEVENV